MLPCRREQLTHCSCPFHDILLWTGTYRGHLPNLPTSNVPISQKQGACQAIEDATVLADSISLFLAGDETALATYAGVREKRAQQVAAFSARYALLHTARLPFGMGKVVRAFVYRILPSSAWMWYLTWLYGFQPVSKRVSSPFRFPIFS